MTATLHASEYVDGLRPMREQLEEFVRVLDQDRGDTERKHERHVIEGRIPMLLTLEHPGGSVGRFRVFPWDLSRGGLGFFHRCYVHAGTKCTFDLRNGAGQLVRIQAKVARCVYVMGTVHYVGVQFDVEISPARFLGELDPAKAAKTAVTGTGPVRTIHRSRPIDPWFEQAKELCEAVESAVEAQVCRDLVRERAQALLEFLKR